MGALVDTLGRGLSNLRISVTDRCNLRCAYCMPEEDYRWLPNADILRFEEVSALVDVFCALGVSRVRLTGGEPLLRKDLPVLVRLLAAKPALTDLALTTNGLLLSEWAKPLADAGLHRVTVSLDTLKPERFRALTRRDGHAQVLEGIATAAKHFSARRPLTPALSQWERGQRLKLDAVILRGVNDDELFDLIEFGKEHGAQVRFIEYMDVGGATRWSMDQVMSQAQMLEALALRFGRVTPVTNGGTAPAALYQLADGTRFGIIASTTAPFCRACDRSRLTADGHWYRCLYARAGLDLKHPLRSGASAQELARLIVDSWRQRTDRGAEERLGLRDRGALVAPAVLRADPHLEMHTRGG
ncbi:MAG: GTP 3',8-cyclase MoaA [Myxococcota bacterium]